MVIFLNGSVTAVITLLIDNMSHIPNGIFLNGSDGSIFIARNITVRGVNCMVLYNIIMYILYVYKFAEIFLLLC